MTKTGKKKTIKVLNKTKTKQHTSQQPVCQRRNQNQKRNLKITVSPLHMNEFHSESMFVSPVCS